LLRAFSLGKLHEHLLAILLLQLKRGFKVDEVPNIVHNFVHFSLVEDVFAFDIILIDVALTANQKLFKTQQNVWRCYDLEE